MCLAEAAGSGRGPMLGGQEDAVAAAGPLHDVAAALRESLAVRAFAQAATGDGRRPSGCSSRQRPARVSRLARPATTGAVSPIAARMARGSGGMRS